MTIMIVAVITATIILIITIIIIMIIIIIIIAQNKGKHNSESNLTLYLSPDLGGRGLKEIEIQYKVTKIKTTHYITTRKDPHIEVVRTFLKVKEAKKSRSVIKDAKTYAQ